MSVQSAGANTSAPKPARRARASVQTNSALLLACAAHNIKNSSQQSAVGKPENCSSVYGTKA
jgi:hypothetical protein